MPQPPPVPQPQVSQPVSQQVSQLLWWKRFMQRLRKPSFSQQVSQPPVSQPQVLPVLQPHEVVVAPQVPQLVLPHVSQPQVSQLLWWKCFMQRLRKPSFSQQVSQDEPQVSHPQLAPPPQEPPPQLLQPAAGYDVTGPATGAAAGAGSAPASQAVVTSKRAAFTRYPP